VKAITVFKETEEQLRAELIKAVPAMAGRPAAPSSPIYRLAAGHVLRNAQTFRASVGKKICYACCRLISAPPLLVPKSEILSTRQLTPDDGSAAEDGMEFVGKSAR
jgi:hypothetical protein